MTNLSNIAAIVVPDAYDFSGFKTIVDIGGGQGALLTAFLGAAPAARGILFDLQVVLDSRPADGPLASVADRVEVVGGDFFASVPAGADCYVMKHILHDWSDEQAIAILKNIRRAMAPDGTLVLVEAVVSPAPGPDMAKLMDLNMLVMCPGGKERTAPEWTELLDAGGFHLSRIVQTPSMFCVIEGKPA